MNRISILAVLLLPFVLGSCTKYQYMTVKSELKKTQYGYVIEKDSLTITYHFAGANCPVKLEVENKSRRPLYIDWSRSVLVINKETHAWNSQSKLSATSTGFGVGSGDGLDYNSADIHGVVTAPMSTGFIPPEAIINSPTINATSQFNKLSRSRTTVIYSPHTEVPIRKQEYTKDESPLKLRSYLTLSDSPEMKDVMIFDSHFWVGTIYQSDISLKNCNCVADAANTFYVSMPTGTGKVLVGTAVLTTLIVDAYRDEEE